MRRFMIDGFDYKGATKGERRAYDLGVRDYRNKLVEWRPYEHFSDHNLIDKYEKHRVVSMFEWFWEVVAFGLLWYFMRPFFWVFLGGYLLVVVYYAIFKEQRITMLKREIAIRKGDDE